MAKEEARWMGKEMMFSNYEVRLISLLIRKMGGYVHGDMSG